MRRYNHHEILAMLRRISPHFSFSKDDREYWYPGLEGEVRSRGLYVSPHVFGGDKFLCGVSEAAVGPYDVVQPNGRTLLRGWMTVLKHVVLSDAAPKRAVEEVFGVTLDLDNPLPRVMECGCEFKLGGEKCPHGNRRPVRGQEVQEELEKLPGVVDARFYPD